MSRLKFRAWYKRTKEMLDVQHCTVNMLNDDTYYVSMQWTGLVDANGVDIYEGDILEGKYGIKVVYDIRETFKTNSACSDCISYSKQPASVVIGNIHENPELLVDV